MFLAGLLLIIRRYCIYSNWYMSCVYVDWLLAGSEWNYYYIIIIVLIYCDARSTKHKCCNQIPVYITDFLNYDCLLFSIIYQCTSPLHLHYSNGHKFLDIVT
jgi:hypothetical protein